MLDIPTTPSRFRFRASRSAFAVNLQHRRRLPSSNLSAFGILLDSMMTAQDVVVGADADLYHGNR